MVPRPILIDTDTGVDDALALILAFRSPEISVKVITTVAGNVEVHKCTRNVRAILELLEISNPPAVIEGAYKPMVRSLLTASEVHGRDGLGNTQRTIHKKTKASPNKAVDMIIQCCAEYRRKLTIIAIGPLTNIAHALHKNPSAMKNIDGIISMGGAFRVPGNTGPVAEFNYYVDPEAAENVLNSGLPVTILPLDTTEQCVLMRSELEAVAAQHGSRYFAFLLQMTHDYMEYHLRTEGFRGGYLHDPLAVAVVVDPSLIETRHVDAHVECRGTFTRGMTVADVRTEKQSGPLRVVTRVDRERFLQLFRERLWK